MTKSYHKPNCIVLFSNKIYYFEVLKPTQGTLLCTFRYSEVLVSILQRKNPARARQRTTQWTNFSISHICLTFSICHSCRKTLQKPNKTHYQIKPTGLVCEKKNIILSPVLRMRAVPIMYSTLCWCVVIFFIMMCLKIYVMKERLYLLMNLWEIVLCY